MGKRNIIYGAVSVVVGFLMIILSYNANFECSTLGGEIARLSDVSFAAMCDTYGWVDTFGTGAIIGGFIIIAIGAIWKKDY